MASIFHYTNSGGLKGILDTKTLFATDYRFLNDSSEAVVIRDLLLPLFESEIADVTPKLIAAKFINEQFYKDHGNHGHRLQAESAYRAIARAADNVSSFFVTSFCRHPQDSEAYKHGLLSQWRGYAEGGGVAIEFDEDGIDELKNEEMGKFAYVGTKTDQVLYEDYEQLFKPEKFIGLASAMIARLFEGQDLTKILGKADIDRCMLDFSITAPFLKHPGFKEECEYRMVAIPIRQTKMPKKVQSPAKGIKFRVRNNTLVPYIEMFEGGSKRLPIKSIIIGPHPEQQLQQESISMMLETKGLDIEVRSSRIPYRR